MQNTKIHSKDQLTDQSPPVPAPDCALALNASSPLGHKCADCQIDGEPCPDCYDVWWRKRHPNILISCDRQSRQMLEELAELRAKRAEGLERQVFTLIAERDKLQILLTQRELKWSDKFDECTELKKDLDIAKNRLAALSK